MWTYATSLGERFMDTITTIQSLLTLNGSARPATVALTPSESRLIAAAPRLLEALVRLVALAESFGVPVADAAHVAIARATQPLPPPNEDAK